MMYGLEELAHPPLVKPTLRQPYWTAARAGAVAASMQVQAIAYGDPRLATQSQAIVARFSIRI